MKILNLIQLENSSKVYVSNEAVRYFYSRTISDECNQQIEIKDEDEEDKENAKYLISVSTKKDYNKLSENQNQKLKF